MIVSLSLELQCFLVSFTASLGHIDAKVMGGLKGAMPCRMTMLYPTLCPYVQYCVLEPHLCKNDGFKGEMPYRMTMLVGEWWVPEEFLESIPNGPSQFSCVFPSTSCMCTLKPVHYLSLFGDGVLVCGFTNKWWMFFSSEMNLSSYLIGHLFENLTETPKVGYQ